MPGPLDGGCLCGALRYSCSAAPLVAGHCQCTSCRKSSGTGHASNMMVPKDAVSVSGEAKVFDKPADSGNVVGRVFCPTCGSVVYATNSVAPQALACLEPGRPGDFPAPDGGLHGQRSELGHARPGLAPLRGHAARCRRRSLPPG